MSLLISAWVGSFCIHFVRRCVQRYPWNIMEARGSLGWGFHLFPSWYASTGCRWRRYHHCHAYGLLFLRFFNALYHSSLAFIVKNRFCRSGSLCTLDKLGANNTKGLAASATLRSDVWRSVLWYTVDLEDIQHLQVSKLSILFQCAVLLTLITFFLQSNTVHHSLINIHSYFPSTPRVLERRVSTKYFLF